MNNAKCPYCGVELREETNQLLTNEELIVDFKVQCHSCGKQIFKKDIRGNQSPYLTNRVVVVEADKAGTGIRETQIGSIDSSAIVDSTLKLSPDLQHIVYASNSGEKWFMNIDGITEGPYKGIMKGSPIISSDSKRVAYGARVDERWFMVLDGKERKPYKSILTVSPYFSPDSQHFTYGAKVEMEYGRFVSELLIIDDEVKIDCDSISCVTYSPNSEHIAYSVFKKRNLLFLDGEVVEDTARDGRPILDIVFSPDSSRLAYKITTGYKQILIVNGNAQKEFDEIKEITYSPDGTQIAHKAKDGDKWLVVIDGQEHKRWKWVGGLKFSPDGKRFAYVVEKADKWFMVVDGQQSNQQYSSVEMVQFSPDGSRMAYSVSDGQKQFQIIDGQESKRYDEVTDAIFSPDNKHFAYAAKTADKWFIIIDGQEEKSYDLVFSYRFSPDSRRLAYVAEEADKRFVVHDGQECKQLYDDIWPVMFDTPDYLHYLALKENNVLLVEESL